MDDERSITTSDAFASPAMGRNGPSHIVRSIRMGKRVTPVIASLIYCVSEHAASPKRQNPTLTATNLDDIGSGAVYR